jgi:serine phosphatase RsbU (regulator of sigma subunit)
VTPETTYDQIDFDLRPGDRLVFLSDGVVEARSKSGELYEFKRVAFQRRRNASGRKTTLRC